MGKYILETHALHHVGREIRANSAVLHHLITKDLAPSLHDGLLGEQREGV